MDLVFSIAFGIIVAKALLYLFKDTIQAVKLRLEKKHLAPNNVTTGDLPKEEAGASAEDWLELWSSLSESAKEQVREFVDDDQLRHRAQDLNLWPFLWSAAPEETKQKLRSRWKASKTQSKSRSSSIR